MTLYRVTFAGPKGHRPRTFRGLGDFHPGMPREIQLDEQGVAALRAKGLTVEPVKPAKPVKGE